jgi:hypothetical protein
MNTHNLVGPVNLVQLKHVRQCGRFKNARVGIEKAC